MDPLSRVLIVNADDFGRSAGINVGVIEAHEHGIVTSASLMTRWPAAVDAASYVRGGAPLDLGLHVDLGEWVYTEKGWASRYEVASLDDESAIHEEVMRQLATFRALTGREPTHLDSHQHVHRHEPARSTLLELAARLGVPLRDHAERVRHCGDFYGQDSRGLSLPNGVTVGRLLQLLHELPNGVSELGCHPGRGSDHNSPYVAERELEVETLCDAAVRVAVAAEGIELASFAVL
jgi:chitin disaccharide deacetylase